MAALPGPAPSGDQFDLYDFSDIAPPSELARQQRRIVELEAEVRELKAQALRRDERLEALTRNISCLFRTATLELERKDALIACLQDDRSPDSGTKRPRRPLTPREWSEG